MPKSHEPDPIIEASRNYIVPPDTVNHPLHYNSHPSGIECIQVVEHLPFNIGNAIKYLWRSGLKENAPTEQDLDKAIWYIEREKVRLRAK